MDLVSSLIVLIIILLPSVILHEIAHGFVAERLGDPTARLAGRLTLNPRKHIDPFMSIALPLILIISGSPIIFGAAKPVPVDPFNLRDGRKDLALVSLAGPLTNIMIAIVLSLIIKIIYFLISAGSMSGFLLIGVGILTNAVVLNLFLAFFNLIPIPPLDGSKIVSLFLPPKEAAMYMSLSAFGMFIIFFLIMFPIGGFSLGRTIFEITLFAKNLLGV